MMPLAHEPQRDRPILPWLAVAILGAAAPALALLTLADAASARPMAVLAGPVLAVGLMSAGMIAAAVSGRLWVGVALALAAGVGLVLFALALGVPPLMQGAPGWFAMLVASVSFAARGALFARRSPERGWWIAVAIVAGEAAVLLTAAASPGAWPAWLLALLPAQWASTALAAGPGGSEAGAAIAALLALAGTAAATWLVAALWPRRWPYLVMFCTWIALSVLVWQSGGPGTPHAPDSPPAAAHR